MVSALTFVFLHYFYVTPSTAILVWSTALLLGVEIRLKTALRLILFIHRKPKNYLLDTNITLFLNTINFHQSKAAGVPHVERAELELKQH